MGGTGLGNQRPPETLSSCQARVSWWLRLVSGSWSPRARTALPGGGSGIFGVRSGIFGGGSGILVTGKRFPYEFGHSGSAGAGEPLVCEVFHTRVLFLPNESL